MNWWFLLSTSFVHQAESGNEDHLRNLRQAEQNAGSGSLDISSIGSGVRAHTGLATSRLMGPKVAFTPAWQRIHPRH